MFKYKLAKSKGMHFATNGTTNSKKAVGELSKDSSTWNKSDYKRGL